jgi:hypothetical protein
MRIGAKEKFSQRVGELLKTSQLPAAAAHAVPMAFLI